RHLLGGRPQLTQATQFAGPRGPVIVKFATLDFHSSIGQSNGCGSSMYAAMLLYWGICMFEPPGSTTLDTLDSRAPGLELHWDAPDPSCPSEAEVAALLEPLLGDEHQQQLVVHASAREHDGHWQLTLD